MNFDKPTPIPEKEPRFPSLEEIQTKMEKLCGQEHPEIVRMLTDEKGVYLHEVVTVDDTGNVSLFSYRRSGNHPETKAATTGVDVAYFVGPIEDGICVGGATLSEYDENAGTWIDTP